MLKSELNDPINSHHFDQVQGTFIFITSSEHNVSSLVIIIGFITGSMLRVWDLYVDMATEEDS